MCKTNLDKKYLDRRESDSEYGDFMKPWLKHVETLVTGTTCKTLKHLTRKPVNNMNMLSQGSKRWSQAPESTWMATCQGRGYLSWEKFLMRFLQIFCFIAARSAARSARGVSIKLLFYTLFGFSFEAIQQPNHSKMSCRVSNEHELRLNQDNMSRRMTLA